MWSRTDLNCRPLFSSSRRQLTVQFNVNQAGLSAMLVLLADHMSISTVSLLTEGQASVS